MPSLAGSKPPWPRRSNSTKDGKITYMRTDSVNLSGQAIASATDFIKRLYGPDCSTVRKFKTKSASPEAHEAIRPTDITRETVTSDELRDQKLYDSRRRTLASQMSPAKLEKTTISADVKNDKLHLKPKAKSSPTTDSCVSMAAAKTNSCKRSSTPATRLKRMTHHRPPNLCPI